MWTLILIYAFRALTTPDWYSSNEPAAAAPAPSQAVPEELTLDQIAAVQPIVRDYLNAARDAEGQLANLKNTLGDRHPRVSQARCRARVMKLRADEFAARFRRDPASLRAYQNPEIRKSLQSIDAIDIELEMLRPNAGPTHPRVRTLRHYREQHEKKIERILWSGMT